MGILNRVSDHTVIAVLVGILALFTTAAIGYIRGEQRRRDERAAIYIRQLEEHERQLRAQGALIEAIAEDYDPAPEHAERRRKLPEGWSIINGGGVLLLLAALGAWIRAHWRTIASTAAAAASITAIAVLAHPPTEPHPLTAPQHTATPTRTAPTAFTAPHAPKPTPTTKPAHTPRSTTAPPPPTLPPSPDGAASADQPIPASPTAPPPPTPSRAPSTSPSPAAPRPTASCPLGMTLRLNPIRIILCG